MQGETSLHMTVEKGRFFRVGCRLAGPWSGEELFRLPLLSLLALTGRNVGHKESIDTVERATERFSQANFAVPQFGNR